MSIFRINTKRLDRITPQERARLNLLTLKAGNGWYSAMRTEILWRKRALNKIQLFLARNSEGIIVAWSSVRLGRKYAYVYTYVMQSYRRQGLGTRLFKRATRMALRKDLIPRVIHTSQNKDFFGSQDNQTRIKVDIGGY